ncbi:MAG: replicative DNA helicase [Raineya sp.]|nr:replicative DNA helicase [Raineya sp.]
MEKEISDLSSRKAKTTSSAALNAFGKLPPQARDVEEIVLGALMLEKNAIMEVGDILQPECFYDPRNQEIYQAITLLFSENEPIDIITVKNKLQKMGRLEAAGGPLYLAELTSKVNSAANIVYHARIVLEAYIKREIIRIVGEVATKAYEDTTDVFDLLDLAERSFFQVSEKNIRKNYVMMKDLMLATLNELEIKRNHQDGLTGVPTGFRDLDRLTGGFQKSNLIIVAARPGMGKSAFMLSMARNAAVDFGLPIAIFSLEMSATELVNRLISLEAEIKSDKIKKGLLDDEDMKQLHAKIGRLSQAQIIIDDTPALSVLELRAKARRLAAQNKIQMIIIDYLQLMSGGDMSKGGNREQEIAYISRSLKNLAKELNIPVIALAQLSRAVETRGGDKKPQLSDLRESGSIEQDADMVIFLYRPEYYKITQDENGMPTNQLGEVIVAKHRNGSTDTIKLRFIGEFTKFTNWEDTSISEIGASFESLSRFPSTPQIPTEFQENPPRSSTEVILSSKLNDRHKFNQSYTEFDEDNPPF